MEDAVPTKVDRRRSPAGNKNYDITKVWEHHKQIARLLVASNGMFKNKEIAEVVGCSEQTVSNVRNNPLVARKIEELSNRADDEAVNINKRMKELAPIAADVLEQTMTLTLADKDGEDQKLRSQGVKAALGSLDYTVPKRVQGTVLHGHVTLDDINKIKQKAFGEIQEAIVVKEEE